MVLAQGLRRNDPYQALLLQPGAPRELIVEAYWSLVSRSRRGDAASPEGARRVEELSDAYALLMDDGSRRALDAAIRQAGQPRERSRGDDHYDVLCVDLAADARIIDLAHLLLSREDQRKRRGVSQSALDDAYRTLSNPQLRAQYDAERGRDGTARRPSIVEVTAPRPAALKPQESRRGILRRGKRRDEVPQVDARDARLLTLRETALHWDVAQATEAPIVQQETDAAAEMVVIAGPQAGRRVPVGARPLTLGGGAVDALLLDGEPDRSLAVWTHGDGVMLRQLEGTPVLVGGRALALPIIALEDGDEIVFGEHVLRYRRIPDA